MVGPGGCGNSSLLNAIADTLLGLIAGYQGCYAEAVVLLDESRRRGEDLWGGEAANYQGLMAYYLGDVAAAQAL